MKKFCLIMAIIGVFALVAFGALLYQETASASAIYQVYIWRAGQGAVTDATVKFKFDDENWAVINHVGYGIYKTTRDEAAGDWQIQLDPLANPDYIGLEPWWGFTSDLLPGTEYNMEWEVEPAR